MIDYQSVIDKYYKSGSPIRETLISHSRQVAQKALDIQKKKNLPISPDDIIAGAMLHDIGIFFTNAPSIHCYGDSPYIAHGVIGANLLRKEGFPEWTARIAERHTGSGLDKDDIESQNLPIPPADYLPETLLEKLICYSDKFFSKGGDRKEKTLEEVRNSIKKFGKSSINRFEAMHELFN